MCLYAVNSFKQNMFFWFCADLSSETQGQSVGSEEDFNHGRKSPGHRLSPDHFKTVTRMLAPDWAQKMLCITVLLCPIGKQHLVSSFRVFVHNGYCLAIIIRFVHQGLGARQTFILYFRNQKRRNYQWLWETFRMLSAGTFQFAPPENSVYGYPGALPPVLENFCRSCSPDPTDCPCVSKDGTDRRFSKKNWLPPLFLAASPLTPQACSWSTVTHKKNE